MLNSLQNLNHLINGPSSLSIIYSLVLSLLLSSIIAFVYQKSFQGLTYSRNFLHTLILSSTVTTMAMLAIGDNLARGFGMMGAMAIIRFRSSLKDPKDMVFIFASLSVGIACGVNSYQIAVIGALFFCFSVFLLKYLPFEKTTYYDGILKFNLENGTQDKKKAETLLNSSCRHFSIVSMKEIAQGSRTDYTYQLKFKYGKSRSKFINNL